jgi:hypothetical protein
VALAVFYPHAGADLPFWKPIAALWALTAISVVVLVWRRTCPAVLVGWFWYLGMLVPVIGLVQVGAQAMADHYTYLPQIGLCIALAWEAMHVVRSWPYRRWVCGVGSVLILAILMACAWRQTTYWHDTETLWAHAVACTSRNARACNNVAWLRATSPDASMRNAKEAVDLARQAVRLSNGRVPIFLDTLAAAYAEAGRFPDAVKTARMAMRLAVQQKQQTLAEALRTEIALYEARKPLRQALPAPTTWRTSPPSK